LGSDGRGFAVSGMGNAVDDRDVWDAAADYCGGFDRKARFTHGNSTALEIQL